MEEHLSSDGPGRMRISKHGGMLTDAVLVSDELHMLGHSDDRSRPSWLTLPVCQGLWVMLGQWQTGIMGMVFQLEEW